MPGVTYDATLTDTGSAVLGGSRVYYVAWEVTVLGPTVRAPAIWDPDQLVGVGHYELGNDLTGSGVLSGLAWGTPRWFHTVRGQNVVSPGEDGTAFLSEIANYIRWAVEPGTEVHLFVFGDT